MLNRVKQTRKAKVSDTKIFTFCTALDGKAQQGLFMIEIVPIKTACAAELKLLEGIGVPQFDLIAQEHYSGAR